MSLSDIIRDVSKAPFHGNALISMLRAFGDGGTATRLSAMIFYGKHRMKTSFKTKRAFINYLREDNE